MVSLPRSQNDSTIRAAFKFSSSAVVADTSAVESDVARAFFDCCCMDDDISLAANFVARKLKHRMKRSSFSETRPLITTFIMSYNKQIKIKIILKILYRIYIDFLMFAFFFLH